MLHDGAVQLASHDCQLPCFSDTSVLSNKTFGLQSVSMCICIILVSWLPLWKLITSRPSQACAERVLQILRPARTSSPTCWRRSPSRQETSCRQGLRLRSGLAMRCPCHQSPLARQFTMWSCTLAEEGRWQGLLALLLPL